MVPQVHLLPQWQVFRPERQPISFDFRKLITRWGGGSVDAVLRGVISAGNGPTAAHSNWASLSPYWVTLKLFPRETLAMEQEVWEIQNGLELHYTSLNTFISHLTGAVVAWHWEAMRKLVRSKRIRWLWNVSISEMIWYILSSVLPINMINGRVTKVSFSLTCLSLSDGFPFLAKIK